MKCLLCQNHCLENLALTTIFSLKPVVKPLLCQRCYQQFTLITGKTCLGCGRPLNQSIDRVLCQDCQCWQAKYQRLLNNRSLFCYDAMMKDYFYQFKKLGHYQLRLLFQVQLQQALKKSPAVLYVPIPSDDQQLAIRGFNPVTALYQDIVKLTPALMKLPTPINQAQKNRQERLKTPQFFALKADFTIPNTCRQIVLLDDIYTTGRTLYHAANKIREYDDKIKITSFTLAH